MDNADIRRLHYRRIDMRKITAAYALIAMLVQILALPQAGAATFNYTSHLYTKNDDPNIFGSNLTASVTLSGAICVDGLYQGSQITDLFLQSGTLSLDINDPNVLIEFDTVQLTNGQITGWALSLYTAGGVDINSTYFSGNLFVVDYADSHPLQMDAYVFNSPNTWSETPLPSALPLFSTGLGLLVLFAWPKKRKYDSSSTPG